MTVDADAAKVALEALPRADREWVLSLPSNEAMLIVGLLVAFPGSHFEKATS